MIRFRSFLAFEGKGEDEERLNHLELIIDPFEGNSANGQALSQVHTLKRSDPLCDLSAGRRVTGLSL